MKALSTLAQSVRASTTMAIDTQFKKMRAEGIDVIGFSVGEPDFPTPEHIKQAGIRAIENDQTKYTPTPGTLALRQAVRKRLQEDWGLDYTTEEIVVSGGGKPILYVALKTLLNPGDEVILPAPYWVSYYELIKMAGGVPVVVETTEASGFNLTPQQLRQAITPKTKGQEDKIAAGLIRLNEEDLTFNWVNNAETRQMVVSGTGDMQMDVILSRLKSRFGVDAELSEPRVPYREKIRKKVEVQGRHKKQTGGHGQFGDVIINFEPCDSEQVVFEEKVFGGSVPKNFFPAVEKGVRLAAEKGVLAGYPVVGLKATLLDGSYHPVDSSEMAFIMAAKLAYKAAMPEAGPVILEPIHTLKAHVPNDNTGDIMGDVTKRRGRVLGMEPDEDGMQTIIAEVPLAELANFTTFIRQITQGRGWFTTEFARYEILPEMLVPAVVEQAKKLGNLDESADD